MEINPTHVLVLAAFVAGLFGCGDDESTAGTQSASSSDTSITEPVASAATTLDTQPPPAATTLDTQPPPVATTLDTLPPAVESDCPFPHGGTCLGPIAAGTYTTTTFGPTITYTVPDGWVNGEDLLGNFLLQQEGDPRYLGIYRNVAAPLECEEHRDPNVDQSVEAITEWLTSHPGLVTTEPEPVSVGGLDGVFVDISLDPSWTVACPYSQGAPVVPFIVGGGPSSLHHVILPGFQERLYLLEMDGGNVAIEVGPEGASLPEYLDVVNPILIALEFTS